jgi:hypothetical protein
VQIITDGSVTTARKQGISKTIATSCMVFPLDGKKGDLSKGEL